jgi:glycosidase
MAWDDSKNCGFTDDGCEPWLINHSRAKEINVKNDLNSKKSVYRFYQELLKLRAGNDVLRDGNVEVISKPEDEFFAYIRSLNDEKWMVICNFGKEQVIELPSDCEEPVLANLERKTSDGLYRPYECAVAKMIC